MFDYILGLPMHALVIHAVVILGPLAALLAIAYVARPAWRHALRWPMALGALVTGGGAFVAAQSGEALLVRVSRVRAATTDFELVQAHVDAGNRAKLFALVFMVLSLGAAWFVREPAREEPRRHALQVLLGVLVVLSAIAALVTIVLAGHAGSAAVWDGLG